MSVIQPTLQKISPPTLPTVLDALAREILKKMSCVKIGVIKEFSPGDATNAPTATVQIAQQQVTSISPDGVRTIQEYPLLLKVPVWFPAGGGFTLTFPVSAGDECLVLFNDRELDNWLETGPGKAPTTGRMHDLSDGIALVGLRSNPRALASIATDETQLRSDSGNTFVGIKNGEHVRLHGGTVYEWDCHGYGQKITYTGSGWVIDNYTDTPNVVTNTHPPAPPGPP